MTVNYDSLHAIYRTDHVFTRKKEAVLSGYTRKPVGNRGPQMSAGNPFVTRRNKVRRCMPATPEKRSCLARHGNTVFSYALATFINMLFVRLNQLLISGTFLEIKTTNAIE